MFKRKIIKSLVITSVLVTLSVMPVSAHGGHHGGRQARGEAACSYTNEDCPYNTEACSYSDTECPYGGSTCADGSGCTDADHHHYQHNTKHNSKHHSESRSRGYHH